MRKQQDKKVTVIIFIVSIVTSQHHLTQHGNQSHHLQPITSSTTFVFSSQYTYKLSRRDCINIT